MRLPFERHASISAEREKVLSGVGEDRSNGAQGRSSQVLNMFGGSRVQRCHMI